MNRDQIIDCITMLARSCGRYGRFLARLEALEAKDPDEYELIMEQLEDCGFSGEVDLVAYLEG